MAQDIINIGPQPNDGQGDNLRTAFDKTNDNFNQIWTAGPVGSNVRIAGNVISTLQVNQDLALSPNGVGNVRLNNNTIPGANNTWFLGSATMQWRGLYAASVETGNITITGTLTVPGDAVIQGNLTVEGDTIQIGNIVTDTKTIQLANTAANAIQANGSGITVGASDNIATFLYNSTSNSWVTNLPITYANGQPIGKTPGGSNTYIQFNDSGNFGGNANFTYNRATGNFYLGGANLRAVAGNSQPYILQVPGIAFQGGSAIMEWDAVNQHVDVSNSFSIAGTLQLYGNYPGDGAVITTSGGSGVDITIEPSGNLYLNADGGEVIVSDQTVSVDPNSGALKVLGGVGVNGNINVGGNITGANITANYFVGNGSLLTGVSSYANANAVAYGEAGWAGNIIPSANATYSLGNTTTRRWKDINLSGNINIGAANISTVPGNLQTAVLSVPGISFLGGNAIMEWDPTNQHVDISNSFSVSGTLALYGNYPGTGALIATSGGSGVDIKIEPSGNLYLNADGGEVIVSDQTVSVDPNSGALKVLGGVGVNGNINAGGNITGGNILTGGLISATGNITAGNISTGVITLTNGATIRDTSGDAVAFGQNAGLTSQGNFAVGIGRNAGQTTQGGAAVAIGVSAGDTSQGNSAVAVGQSAGFTNQSANTVAVGVGAGQTSQGVDAVAVGASAGSLTQGIAAVAIGTLAGRTFQANNSIIINATGGILDQTTANTFTVAPVRNDVANVGNVLFYNTTSKEITYGNVISVAGNITGGNILTGGLITAIGNITANYFIGDGSQLTGLPASYSDANVATFLAAYGSNTISTTGNVTAGNFIGAGSNVELIAQSEQWLFDTTGNLTLPTAGYLLVQTGIIGAGASPAPTLSGFSSIATTGVQGNISASGNLLAAGYANITGNINGSGATFSGNVAAQNFVGNISITGNVQGTTANVTLVAGAYSTVFDNIGTATLPGALQLAVYANTTVRDTAIPSPTPGMMIYVTGTGMQVRGATGWNTIAGSGT